MQITKNYILCLFFLFLITFCICYRKNYIKPRKFNNISCDTYNRQKKNFKRDYNIVCSFTTSPTRINKTFDTVYTLINQTVQPDYILINIPFVFQRTNERYLIPDFISNNRFLKINRTQKDYGPATKLVGAVEYIPKDSNTWIIVHDDDILYMQETIEEYYKHIESTSALANRYAFTFSGLIFKNIDVMEPEDSNLKTVNVVEGYSTYCVHRSYFDDDFIPYINFLISTKDARLSDDLIISNYLQGKGIKCFQLFTKSVNKRNIQSSCVLDYGRNSDALHQLALKESSTDKIGGHYEKYVRVLNYLSDNNINYIN